MRPSAGQLRVARDFASARRDKRDPLPRIGTGDGAASASKRGDEGCVAAQSFAVARRSVDNAVEAATVAGVNLRRRCARQALLRLPGAPDTLPLGADLAIASAPSRLHPVGTFRSQLALGPRKLLEKSRGKK